MTSAKSTLLFALVCSFLFSIVSAQGTLNNGLVAYYKFQHSANDQTANHFNATLFGTAAIGSTLKIPNGTSGYLIIPPAVINGLNDFSVSVNVQFNRLVHSSVHQILDAECSNNPRFGLAYDCNNQGGTHWATNINNVDKEEWPQVVQIKTWYNAVVIRRGSEQIFYVDGVVIDSLPTTPGTLCAESFIAGQYEDCGEFCISFNNSLNGQIDNLRIYNRALVPSEVVSLSTMRIAGSGNETESPLAIYPNPLTTSATITFTLNHPSHGSLKLFSLDAKEAMIIADENFSEGSHEVDLNSESLIPGIYFLQLKTDEGILTKKVVIE